MEKVAIKLKALFGKFVKQRTAPFRNLALSGKIKGILAKKLTEDSNLPNAIVDALKGTKVFKVVRLKDGRIRVWTKTGKATVERYLFSADASPRIIKKSSISHSFAKTEIHKGVIPGYKDTGYSVTRRVDKGMRPITVDGFRTTRIAKFDKSSEWQDVTEHINLNATNSSADKFVVGRRHLDIVPVYNDIPSLMSKPISDIGEVRTTEKALSLKDALASVKSYTMPELNKSRTAVVIRSDSGLPTTINAYKQRLFNI